MNSDLSKRKRLLPPGMQDLLPPQAGLADALLSRLSATIQGFGYAKVSPPVIEYSAAGDQHESLRLQDPATNRWLALRSDLTLQVIRIASERMKLTKRPLRLFYNGTIFRPQARLNRFEREFPQVGAELIGSKSNKAQAEIITIIDECFADLGLACYFDFCAPLALNSYLVKHFKDEAKISALRRALTLKDRKALEDLCADSGRDVTKALCEIIEIYGWAEEAVPRFLATSIGAGCDYLKDLSSLFGLASRLRFDASDISGFSYQSSLAFSVFLPDVRTEVGRGGCYLAGKDSAVGFSLYPGLFIDAAEKNCEALKPSELVFLTRDQFSRSKELRLAGYRVIHALEDTDTSAVQGRMQGCTLCWRDGRLQNITKEESKKKK